MVNLELPLYLLVERKGPRFLPAARPVSHTVTWHHCTRRCVLGYRSRQSAAAWNERLGGHLRLLPVRNEPGLDRLAAVAALSECGYLALEPAAGGADAELVVDLVTWLGFRRPWSEEIEALFRVRGLPASLARA